MHVTLTREWLFLHVTKRSLQLVTELNVCWSITLTTAHKILNAGNGANITLTDIPLFLHDLCVYPQETRRARGAAKSLPLPSNTSSNNVATLNANENKNTLAAQQCLHEFQHSQWLTHKIKTAFKYMLSTIQTLKLLMSLVLLLKNLVYMAQHALQLSCIQHPAARHQTYYVYHLRLKFCIQDELLRSRTLFI